MQELRASFAVALCAGSSKVRTVAAKPQATSGFLVGGRMPPFAKNVIRKAIRVMGFDVTKLDAHHLGGHSLLHELPLLVENQSPTVVDVGANRGQRIELARHAFRSPQITSFEPNPHLA